jgi:antitoxin HigA-1
MTTKKKSKTVRFLERLNKGPLTIAQAIESVRLSNEQTQIAFAKKLKISTSHLCDIEKGRKVVSPSRAAKFARVLGHSVPLWITLALQQELDEAGLKFVVHVEAA